MMKRILALLLSILLITGSMVTPVFAAEAGGSITVSPANPHPGDTFTATLSVSNLGEIASLAVEYNTPSGLTIVEAKWLKTGALTDIGGGRGVLAFSETDDNRWLNGTHNLVTITYKVSEGIAVPAECKLSMTLRYTNVSNETKQLTASNTVTVTKACTHPVDQQVTTGAQEATCTKVGYTGETTCKACGTVLKANSEIKQKEHKASSVWSHDETHHWHDCIYDCNTQLDKVEIEWVWVVDTPATEDAAGVQHQECSKCQAKRNEGTEIPQRDHVHTATKHDAVAATCTEPGNVTYWTCSSSKCAGKYYGDANCTVVLTSIKTDIDAQNHTGGTEIRDKESPTCGEDGYTGDTYCLGCQKPIKQGDTDPATGKHVTGDKWESNGTDHWKICSVCEKELEKAKHDFEVVPDTPATEAEPGIGHEECTVCEKTGKQNLTIDKLEHRHTGIVKHNAVTATCTEPGNVTYWTCSGDLCKGKFYGDSKCTNELPSVETPVDPDNHIGGTATCKEKAVCTRCKKSYGELNSNNHTGGTEIKNKKDATCGAAGYTGDTWCKGCNVMTQKGKEIAATGRHTAGAEWKTDSTNHWHICAVCNAQVDKAAHNFQWTTDKEPTEDATGLKHEECHICHMKRNEGTVIEKLDHKHTGITRHTAVAATCIKEGNVEYWTCSSSKCSGKYYGDANCTTILTTIKTSVNSANHTGGTEIKNKKDATCYAEGYTGDSCCVSCGAVITTGQTIPATGKHNAGAEWRYDSTNHWHICTNSGCSQKVDVTSHTYTWVVDKAATEDSVGAKHEECVCGSKRSEGTEIPKLDHKHSGITHHKAVPATCVATGTVEYWTCSHTKCAGKYYGDAACQILLKTINEPVNKNNHTGGTEIKNKKAATCGEAGYTGDIYCTSCKNVREQGEMIPATGKHTPKTGYQKDAEFHWQLCSVCNAVMDGVKEEHTYTWIVDKEASETAAGKKHQECTVCGHKSNENTVIEKLPHDLKFVAAKSCTCTEDGCVEHFHCAGCGKYYLSENGKVGKETTAQGVLVPASGHTGDGAWLSDETSHWHKCGCGEDYDAEDHKTEIIGAVEPTETAEGYSGDTVCQICGIVVAEGEALPVVIPETTPATEPEPEVTEPASEVTEPETAEPESAKKTAVSPVVIVAAAAVAVAGAAGGAVIFLRKRKF